MRPRLIAIAGPLRGGTFYLDDKEVFSVGRSRANELVIEDPSVSRRHCSIERAADRYRIIDNASVNRTFINGIPRSDHLLQDGDEIKVGESLFLFLKTDERRAAVARSMDQTLEDTILLRAGERRRTVGWADAGGYRTPSRTARYLDALLQIGERASSSAGSGAVQEEVLQALAGVIPSDFGGIVLINQETGETISSFQWKRGNTTVEQLQSASAIIDRVARERTPLLWQTAADGRRPADPGRRAGPVLGAPLSLLERFLGVIYLGSSDPAVRFDPDYLQFLSAAAPLAAALLESALDAENREMLALTRRAEANLEHNMVGEGREMRRIYDFIGKVAPTGSTVLIRGESGTGKELVARAMHRNSPRHSKPFTAINCAALTETLLESEFFGHERGAFTGATTQKKGKLEEAAGGTVFLDEIGEMSPVLQAKLLRVLQEKEFERVGGTRTIRADIRVIAATNRDLETAIRQGTFREDLFYRLNVVSLTMPPLRERREDIPALAMYFAQKHCKNLKRWLGGISETAMGLLQAYDWPGNVRELENAIERAVVLGTTDTILPEDLPESVMEAGRDTSSRAGGLHASIVDAKKQMIIDALAQANGNYTEAARLLDVHPNSLHRIIRNLHLKVARS